MSGDSGFKVDNKLWAETGRLMDEGHPLGAVAAALAEIAHAHYSVADALDRLGMFYHKPGGPPGAVEKLAMEMERLAGAMETIASSYASRE